MYSQILGNGQYEHRGMKKKEGTPARDWVLSCGKNTGIVSSLSIAIDLTFITGWLLRASSHKALAHTPHARSLESPSVSHPSNPSLPFSSLLLHPGNQGLLVEGG